MNNDRTLVAVFDSGHARFFEYKQPHGELVPIFDEIKSRLDHDRRDIETDRPGRGFESGEGGQHHAYESQHDPRKLEKHDLVVRIAQELDSAFEQHQFARLAIVAPVRSVGEFRSVASEKLKKTVWREVEKEFANLTDSELEKHLVPILQSPPK
ncbi:MAG TPA: host attachment protein [Rhizomicrobium sp.]|jgi:protein required for attachment to host cells